MLIDAEEGHAGGAVAPVGLVGALVPGGEGRGLNLVGLTEVVVGLRIVGAVVTGGAEVLGEALDLRGRDALTAHVAGAEGGGIHAGDDGGARGGADAVDGEGVGVAGALSGEVVQVGGAGVGVAVAAKVGAGVFGGDPEDIGRGGRLGWAAEEAARMAGAAAVRRAWRRVSPCNIRKRPPDRILSQ